MKTLIQNAIVVNEGRIEACDVLIHDHLIHTIAPAHSLAAADADAVIDATGLHLLPGVIDDQVHFREPGLTHKGDLYTEPRAAVAGGMTSFMEMPNTVPSAVTLELLEEKYTRASEISLANYSFYMGTTNTNLKELLRVDPKVHCGVKIFMGSSTGDMLVDDPNALESIFENVKTIITTHCEDDPMIKRNAARAREQYGEDVPMSEHPNIRSAEACYSSSSYAVDLATRHNTRLHILHISTAQELSLFRNDIPMMQKRITSEACVHHLWFSDEDYAAKGSLIKWNPAVKTAADREAILQAVLDDRIDVIATDHAPHTLDEKSNTYFKAPSGGPLVQHSLVAMLELHHRGKISLEKIVEKMVHNVALMFQIDRRGFVREGHFADLVLVNLHEPWTVSKENLLYKCGWSPFEGTTFQSKVITTFVNGHKVYDRGTFDESKKGMRLSFNR